MRRGVWLQFDLYCKMLACTDNFHTWQDLNVYTNDSLTDTAEKHACMLGGV